MSTPRSWRGPAAVAALLLACGWPAAPAGASGLSGDASPPTGQAYLSELAERINAYRRAQGLAPLAPADELVALANGHSQSMAALRQMSHEGFRQRFRSAGAKVCVENLGWNYPTPEGLLEGWRLSASHHRNLLEPRVARMGLAASGDYVTFFACR